MKFENNKFQLPFYKIEYHKFTYEELFNNINTKILFQARWKFERKNLSEEEWLLLNSNALIQYNKLKNEIIDKNLLSEAIGCFAFFPATSFNNKIAIYLQDNSIIEWEFPRQNNNSKLCIADFIDSNNKFIVLWALTTGSKIENEVKTKYHLGYYYEYFLLAGLAAELAETSAQVLHNSIFNKIKSLNTSHCTHKPENNPKFVRYSFGYPCCPNLTYQKSLLMLINAESIGISLSENFIMVPEFSVAGFSIYHPNAQYFNI